MPDAEASDRAPPQVVLRVRGLERGYPNFHLGPIDLDLDRGETLVVLGPNGSGKSTLLRVLAGLEPTDRGRVELLGRDLTTLPPHQRGIGMVFQDLALFPTRTVWENLTYGPIVQGWARGSVEARGEELLEQFRLKRLADRRPPQLSGGERQRVALARALAPRPSLLLLDEPLSSADPRLARELRSEIKGFLRAAETPAIYVTHDLEEGFFLGHRAALLHEGTWVQEGRTEEVFEHPRNAFAAWFLGYNVLRVASKTGPPEALACLPDHVRVVPPGSAGALTGTVESLGSSGAQTRAYVRLSEGPSTEGLVLGPAAPLVETVLPPERPLAFGERVGLKLERPLRLPGEIPSEDPVDPS